MKKKLASLLFSGCLLFSTNFAHAESKLFGLWKGSGVSLHLKKGNTYRYKMKLLSIKGTWSTDKNNLILNYSILGIKKIKQSRFALDRNKLILSLKGKKDITLIRQ